MELVVAHKRCLGGGNMAKWAPTVGGEAAEKRSVPFGLGAMNNIVGGFKSQDACGGDKKKRGQAGQEKGGKKAGLL